MTDIKNIMLDIKNINILTRTCNRPNYFALCANSITSQSYPYWHHIIGHDDICDYLTNDDTRQIIVPLIKEIKTPVNTFPYNL